MPVFIECIECHRKLRVRTELLGKHVRCPSCRTRFLATAAEATAAPPAEGGLTHAEAAASTESSEVAVPPPKPEGADESSGPTVRRPRPDLPPDTMNPVPPEAVTVHPHPPPPPPKSSRALEPAGPTAETPWEKVGLVVALILLSAVLIGLVGAWWVHAGVRASEAKAGAAQRAEATPGSAHPRPAAVGRLRPWISLSSPVCSESSA
jgi:hypothetical protein